MDLRHLDDATLAAMPDQLRAKLAGIAEAPGCTVEIVDLKARLVGLLQYLARGTVGIDGEIG